MQFRVECQMLPTHINLLMGAIKCNISFLQTVSSYYKNNNNNTNKNCAYSSFLCLRMLLKYIKVFIFFISDFPVTVLVQLHITNIDSISESNMVSKCNNTMNTCISACINLVIYTSNDNLYYGLSWFVRAGLLNFQTKILTSK